VGGTQGFARSRAQLQRRGVLQLLFRTGLPDRRRRELPRGPPGRLRRDLQSERARVPGRRGAGAEFRDGLGGGHVARQRDKRVCTDVRGGGRADQ
jgi:hypothetical protein